MLDRRGRTLKGVVQLRVEEVVPIDTFGLPSLTCDVCGRVRYLPVTRGPTPPLARRPANHMFKSEEYFGSGASAFREVMSSQDLRTAIEAAGARGVSFIPVTGDSRPNA